MAVGVVTGVVRAVVRMVGEVGPTMLVAGRGESDKVVGMIVGVTVGVVGVTVGPPVAAVAGAMGAARTERDVIPDLCNHGV